MSLRIISSYWGKVLRIMSVSHSFVPGLRMSLTLHDWVASVGGPIGAIGSDVDSQGSAHTPASIPDPRAQRRPFSSRSLPSSRPHHPWEAHDGYWTFRKEEWTQYFPIRVVARSDFGSLIILHDSLANIASLNWAISRNPRPPALIGLVKVRHETQQIFLAFGEASHQNLVRIDCSCLQSDMGSLKH